MVALFGFEAGNPIRMRSPTFEAVMEDTKLALSDPTDKTIIDEALELNYLTVDLIVSVQKDVLPTLYRVLGEHLTNGRHSDDEVALAEVQEIRSELARRYPQYTRPDKA